MTPELGPPIAILPPQGRPVPLVVSSPHSGQIYPHSLLRAVRVSQALLRRLEDGWVDELFGGAPEIGAPLLLARFARAYVDVNREAFELDPELFDEPLPDQVNLASAKARAGLGTIPSRIGGQAIYRARLRFAEAERRGQLAYWPYHHALADLLQQARSRFGGVLLLDCHSMPSLTASGATAGGSLVDVALGDRFGRSCAPAIMAFAEALLRRHGLRVARNRPYAGGHITAHYGRPAEAVHALQIEIRRGLYMDELSLRPHGAMVQLRALLKELLAGLAGLLPDLGLAGGGALPSGPLIEAAE
jgi:N-formylglutamate amidohydrolase